MRSDTWHVLSRGAANSVRSLSPPGRGLGSGGRRYRKTLTPHPNPLPKGEGTRLSLLGDRCASRLFSRLEHLAAAVHAGLQINVVRATQLARILVLDVARALERIGRAAHPSF